MNPAPDFEGFELENSVLCKHHKIAARVQTIVCEAEPVRLTDISHLKRLGPQASETYGRCQECRQYQCTCLWEQHLQGAQSNMLESSDGMMKGTKCKPNEDSTLYKLRKRNAIYGNVNTADMTWVMRPVPRMRFTSSRDSLEERKTVREIKEVKELKAKVKNCSSDGGEVGVERMKRSEILKQQQQQQTKFNLKRSQQSPRIRMLKGMGGRDSILSGKNHLPAECFIGQSRMVETRGTKFNHHRSRANRPYDSKIGSPIGGRGSKIKSKYEGYIMHKVSTRPPGGGANTNTNPTKTNSKTNELSLRVNMTMTVAPKQIPMKPPDPPGPTPTTLAKGTNYTLSGYTQRVNDMMLSRSMFANSKLCPNDMPTNTDSGISQMMQMSDSFSYPSRFKQKKNSPRDSKVGKKGAEFLFKYEEAGKARPARTIDSLEEIESQANEAKQRYNGGRFTSDLTNKKNSLVLAGAPSILTFDTAYECLGDGGRSITTHASNNHYNSKNFNINISNSSRYKSTERMLGKLDTMRNSLQCPGGEPPCRMKMIRGEPKTLKSVAVQTDTDEMIFNSMPSQPTVVYESQSFLSTTTDYYDDDNDDDDDNENENHDDDDAESQNHSEDDDEDEEDEEEEKENFRINKYQNLKNSNVTQNPFIAAIEKSRTSFNLESVKTSYNKIVFNNVLEKVEREIRKREETVKTVTTIETVKSGISVKRLTAMFEVRIANDNLCQCTQSQQLSRNFSKIKDLTTTTKSTSTTLAKKQILKKKLGDNRTISDNNNNNKPITNYDFISELQNAIKSKKVKTQTIIEPLNNSSFSNFSRSSSEKDFATIIHHYNFNQSFNNLKTPDISNTK